MIQSVWGNGVEAHAKRICLGRLDLRRGRFKTPADAPLLKTEMTEPRMIRISDLRDPNDPQGRSYREVNAAKTHKYPIGALVELNHGVRLWVVHHARDCDQTPLYCLSADPNDTEIEREGFYNASWVKGIAEQYLTFIRMVNAAET